MDPIVATQLFEIFSTAEGAVFWMTQPATVLGGQIPIDVAMTKKGNAQVSSMLAAISHGNVM
jgi:uncharacterized protein (DUF2384 family)